MVNADEFFRTNLMPSGFAVQRARQRLQAIQSGAVGFRSGLAVLDDYFRLMPSELTAIGARPGTGKTAFGMQMVYAVLLQLARAEQPGCVVVFSAEMEGESLMLREACALEGVPYWSIQTKQATPSEFQRVDARLLTLDNSRLLIDESPAPTLEHMIEQVDAVHTERGPVRLVLFDYTELAGEFDREEYKRIAKISRGLKAIAKKFSVPVLTLAQLNRDIEARADRVPSMRDLMSGGEREPDRIMIMVRPWMFDKSQPRELVNTYIVKNRNGKQGEAQLYFDERLMRFNSAEVKMVNGNGHEQESEKVRISR